MPEVFLFLSHPITCLLVRTPANVYVRWGGVYSSSFTDTNGVRQGGILSPYLFNVYVNDLSVKLNSCHVRCYYSGGCINHIMYADDLVIMSPSVAGLYKLLHMICESFGLSHDVLFNNKTISIMSFRTGNLKDAHLPLCTLNGEVLCDSACVKDLGHFICSDLTDDTDILRQRRCLSIQENVLLGKFHMCSIGVRLALFRSFCSPMYTSQLCWNYKKCNMKRLLITYHNVFKMSISKSKYESTSLLCSVYNVLCCQAVIINLVYRFMCRLQPSNNSLVMSMQSSSLV